MTRFLLPFLLGLFTFPLLLLIGVAYAMAKGTE